jgi:sporulation protein YlmC with PRC-barrel domain
MQISETVFSGTKGVLAPLLLYVQHNRNTVMKKFFIPATAAAIFMSTPVWAINVVSPQTETPVVVGVETSVTPVVAAIAEVISPFITANSGQVWSVNDLKGKDVYGIEGESIGSVSDVLVSHGGVSAVVIDVGGFLGIGSKSVAVDMATLQVGPGTSQAEADQTAQVVADLKAVKEKGADVALNNNDASDEKTVIGSDGLPDRIVLNVTREQLETAPEYKKS